MHERPAVHASPQSTFAPSVAASQPGQLAFSPSPAKSEAPPSLRESSFSHSMNLNQALADLDRYMYRANSSQTAVLVIQRHARGWSARRRCAALRGRAPATLSASMASMLALSPSPRQAGRSADTPGRCYVADVFRLAGERDTFVVSVTDDPHTHGVDSTVDLSSTDLQTLARATRVDRTQLHGCSDEDLADLFAGSFFESQMRAPVEALSALLGRKPLQGAGAQWGSWHETLTSPLAYLFN